MNVQVERNWIGHYESVKILNISARELVLFQLSIGEYLESKKESLMFFQKSLAKEIARKADESTMTETKDVIKRIEATIEELEKIINELDV